IEGPILGVCIKDAFNQTVLGCSGILKVPTKFELVTHLKAAKGLGLPAKLLVRPTRGSNETRVHDAAWHHGGRVAAHGSRPDSGGRLQERAIQPGEATKRD